MFNATVGRSRTTDSVAVGKWDEPLECSMPPWEKVTQLTVLPWESGMSR